MKLPKNGCFVVKRYAVREAKTWRYAVHKAEIGRHAVRKGVSPSWKWIVVHVFFIRFRIPDQVHVYCNNSQKNNNSLFKTFILQKKWLPLAHGRVKAFDDYMCTNVNVKKCISYIVNENFKICYTVQFIKVQDLYILPCYVHSMYIVFQGCQHHR